MNVKEFGEQLRAIRKEKRLTLMQLEELTGYSHPYLSLSQIETGKKKSIPSSELLERLATALKVPYSSLLTMAGYDGLAKEIELGSEQENTDLKDFLEQKLPLYAAYNGHKLTNEDHRRILDVLNILFPERSSRVRRTAQLAKPQIINRNKVAPSGQDEKLIGSVLRTNIQRLIDGKGWTLYSLSKRSGVSLTVMYSLGRKERGPTAGVLVKLADALGVAVDELVRVDSSPN